MRAAQKVLALLHSAAPNWDSVSLREISSAIQRAKLRYSQLRRIGNDPKAAEEARSAIKDVKRLYAASVRKRSALGIASLDEAITAIDDKTSRTGGINSFDAEHLAALKSARARLVAQQSRAGSLVAAVPRRAAPVRSITHPIRTASTATFAEVAEVEGAFSTEVDGDHSHFVKHPIRPGLQPCLIEVRQLGGTVTVVDALTVLPSGVRSQRVVDPIYAAYLDLIDREYEADISASSVDPQVLTWSVKSPDDPPFECAAVNATRERVFSALEASHLLKGSTANQNQRFIEEVAELVHGASQSSLWHPRNLKVGRTAAKWGKAWAVLARWEDWEVRRLNWTQRLVEHSADLKKPVTRIAQERDALRKLCKSIGLNRGALSPAKRLLAGPLPLRIIRL